jgi:hypothetical protein
MIGRRRDPLALGNASLLNATLLNEMVGNIEANSDGIAILCA